jgi:hypothetical protein
MADPDEIVAEEVGSTGMIRMVVRVDKVSDRVGNAFGCGNLVYRAAKIVADRRRGIEEDDSLVGGEECRLVSPVGHPEQVPLDSSHVVAVVIESRSECGRRDGHVVGQ